MEDLAINYAERRVAVAGRPVVLTATEYALLFELSTNAGLVVRYSTTYFLTVPQLRTRYSPTSAGASPIGESDATLLIATTVRR